jgi:hypothetical protein
MPGTLGPPFYSSARLNQVRQFVVWQSRLISINKLLEFPIITEMGTCLALKKEMQFLFQAQIVPEFTRQIKSSQSDLFMTITMPFSLVKH